MFEGVNKKLERADFFLNNLKTLADQASGFSYIPAHKQQEMRANLDGYFFEIVSAKDFFLQGINDKYALGLPSKDATNIGLLKRRTSERDVLQVLTSIEKLLSERNSWLWLLNNYRNSATHRELLHVGHEVEMTRANAKGYLFKDPDDGSQGNADTEVIPYCEYSSAQMREFLEQLHSKLPTTAKPRGARSKVEVIALQYCHLAIMLLLVNIFVIAWYIGLGRELADMKSELIRRGFFLQSLGGFAGLLAAIHSVWKLPSDVTIPRYWKLIDRQNVFMLVLPFAAIFFLLGILCQIVGLFMP